MITIVKLFSFVLFFICLIIRIKFIYDMYVLGVAQWISDQVGSEISCSAS